MESTLAYYERFKVYSHLTFASTSPSKFNIASTVTQTQMHRMGLNPFLMFYIDANVKCEYTINSQKVVLAMFARTEL